MNRSRSLLQTLVLGTCMALASCTSTETQEAEEQSGLRESPVSYHLSFDDREFLNEEFIELSGRLSLEERGIEFTSGRFGEGFQMTRVPNPPDAHNMTGIDLDLVAAAMFNSRPDNQMGYTEPMLWGTGRINTRLGSVAFWARGEPPYHGLLFEQTSVSFGKTERDLLGVYLDEDLQLSAYLRDGQYERHELVSDVEWNASDWNHVVLNWDWANGLELWLNGEVVASSWGDGGWFETAPSGLFHFPMPMITYDELYLMDRPLTGTEIAFLMEDNSPPGEESIRYVRGENNPVRVAEYSGLHQNERLPVATPASGISLTEVWPEFVGDGNIPGWHMIDGRNELAWPHPYSLFTIIPGDADFHAEKADIRIPEGERVNYMTLTGNLANVQVLYGLGGMNQADPVFSVPQDHGFFYGHAFETSTGGTFRIPFTEVYGTPSEYAFEGARYRVPYSEMYGSPEGFEGDVNLPLSGEKRIQNVGLYYHEQIPGGAVREEGRTLQISAVDELMVDSRWQLNIHAATSRDERRFAVASEQEGGQSQTLGIGGMTRLNILSEPYEETTGVQSVTLRIPVRTLNEEEALYVRVHDPALPVRLWNEFAINLEGFDGSFELLELTIDFQDMVLAEGDRLWIDLATAGSTDILLGDESIPAELQVKEVDSWLAVDAWAEKQMIPAQAQYSKMYGYMPWKFDGRDVDLEDPYALGGPFDMILPAQVVQRVQPDHFLADFMVRMSSSEFGGGHPSNPEERERITIDGPDGAPDWAIYMRDFNQKRQRLVEWWLDTQNPDGQIGGGWNDDTIFFIGGLKDLLYDSPPAARELHDAIHVGMEHTDLFANGYCNIHPMDRMHVGDFVSERYHTMIHNLGQPHAVEREMESAWHLDKPEQTPMNYSEGIPFFTAVNVFHWYWGEEGPEEPYESKPLDEIGSDIQLYTSWLDDTYFHGVTAARTHTTSQAPYGSRNMFSYMLGGASGSRWDAHPELSVSWPSGGGPDVARVVRYADDTSLEVAAYSFDEQLRELQMRLMRLTDGHYRISIHQDPSGNGEAGGRLWSVERDLRRFDVLSLPMPSQQAVLIRVEQLESHGRPARLADLAMNPWGAVYENGRVTVQLHNLGNGEAGAFTVQLLDGETVVDERRIDGMEAPSDFVARRMTVSFDRTDWTDRLSVIVDPENEVPEILTDNNRVRVIRSTDDPWQGVTE